MLSFRPSMPPPAPKRRKTSEPLPDPIPEPEIQPYGSCRIADYELSADVSNRISSQFTNIKSIVWKNGILHVLDQGVESTRIVFIEKDKIIEELSWSNGIFGLPPTTSSALAVSSSGALYVALEGYIFLISANEDGSAILEPIMAASVGTYTSSSCAITVDSNGQAYCIPLMGGILMRSTKGGKFPQRCATVYTKVASLSMAGDNIAICCHLTNNILLYNLDTNFQSSESIGTGAAGHLDGPASDAQFHCPVAAVEDGNGNLFVADSGNNMIRFIKKKVIRTLCDVSTANPSYPLPLSVAKPKLLAFDQHRGWLYVTQESDPNVLRVIRGFPGNLWSFVSPLAFEISEFGEKITIETMGAPLVLHKTMAELRCPGLINSSENTPLPLELSPQAANAFLKYIYGDEIPLAPPQGFEKSKFYLQLFILGSRSGLEKFCDAIVELMSLHLNFTTDQYFEMFLNSIEAKCHKSLLPFISARLARNKIALKSNLDSMKTALCQIGSNGIEYYIELLEWISTADTTSVQPSASKLSPKLSALRRQMRGLFTQRHINDENSTADFRIILGGEKIVPCHSFILGARWPYFQQMLHLGGREASERILPLPLARPIAPDDDPEAFQEAGGLTEAALLSILEYCYTGSLCDATIDQLSLQDITIVLQESDFYCLTPLNATAQSGADFGPFLKLMEDLYSYKYQEMEEKNEKNRLAAQSGIFAGAVNSGLQRTSEFLDD